jgi:hypothetical protein
MRACEESARECRFGAARAAAQAVRRQVRWRRLGWRACCVWRVPAQVGARLWSSMGRHQRVALELLIFCDNYGASDNAADFVRLALEGCFSVHHHADASCLFVSACANGPFGPPPDCTQASAYLSSEETRN